MNLENEIKLMQVIEKQSSEISDVLKLVDMVSKLLEQLEKRVSELEK